MRCIQRSVQKLNTLKATHDTFRTETQVIHVNYPAERRAHGMTHAESIFGQEALVSWIERVCGVFPGAEEEKEALCWAKEI